jgi:hypothetical protein
MTETAQLALITMIGATLTGLIAAIPGILGYLKGRENAEKITQLSLDVDGRLSELLAANKAQAHAEGVIQGGIDAERPVGEGEAKALQILEEAKERAIRMLEEARVLAQAHLNNAAEARRENTAALGENDLPDGGLGDGPRGGMREGGR